MNKSELFKDSCFVETDENGCQYVCMPDGTRIPGQISSAIEQSVDDRIENGLWCARATITITCYIEETKRDDANHA